MSNDDLNDAVAGTEQDLFAQAMKGEDADIDDGDRSLEEMGDGPEGQHLPEDDEGDIEALAEPPRKPAEPDEPVEEPEEPDEKPEEEEPEPEALKGLPVAARQALLSERKARQAAEAAAKAADERHRADLAAANARLDRLLAGQQPAQPQQAAPQAPDPVLDPQGFTNHLRAQMEQQNTLWRIETSFADTHETLGKEFETAYGELQKLNPQNPVDQATGRRIYTAPNPGKALMKWHREQTALREMGGDPAAYRQKLRDEILNDPDMVKAVLAKAREQNGRPGVQNITRLPPSLNRARGGSSAKEVLSAADGTDEAVFDYAMNGT